MDNAILQGSLAMIFLGVTFFSVEAMINMHNKSNILRGVSVIALAAALTVSCGNPIPKSGSTTGKEAASESTASQRTEDTAAIEESMATTNASEQTTIEQPGVEHTVKTEEIGPFKKGAEIPIIVRGVEVRLGETTLTELGGEMPYDIASVFEEKENDSTIVTLMTFNDDDKITVDNDNGTVQGICIDCNNWEYQYAYYDGKGEGAKTRKNDLVMIGGICVGASRDEIGNTFGDPTKVGSYSDGFGTHMEYEFEDGYKLIIKLMGGSVDYMNINRKKTEN